jgi:transposase
MVFRLEEIYKLQENHFLLVVHEEGIQINVGSHKKASVKHFISVQRKHENSTMSSFSYTFRRTTALAGYLYF